VLVATLWQFLQKSVFGGSQAEETGEKQSGRKINHALFITGKNVRHDDFIEFSPYHTYPVGIIL